MKKDAIIVLGGGIVKDPNGTWRTTNYYEGDRFGVLGDRMRVLAANYLYKDNPNSVVFVLGGRGQMSKTENDPAVCEVMSHELRQMGVPKEDILVEKDSANTLGQLKVVKNIILKYELKKVFIISNRYHLPRVEAILRKTKELKGVFNLCSINLREAENVVTNHEPDRREEIDAVYKSKIMQNRIVLENKGVEDINMGKYKYNE